MPPQTRVSSYRRSLPETYPSDVCSSVRPRSSMSSVNLGFSILRRGWTIPSFHGYSACCANTEEANAKNPTIAKTRAGADQSRKAFVTSTTLRTRHLHYGARSRELRTDPELYPGLTRFRFTSLE